MEQKLWCQVSFWVKNVINCVLSFSSFNTGVIGDVKSNRFSSYDRLESSCSSRPGYCSCQQCDPQASDGICGPSASPAGSSGVSACFLIFNLSPSGTRFIFHLWVSLTVTSVGVNGVQLCPGAVILCLFRWMRCQMKCCLPVSCLNCSQLCPWCRLL